MFLFRHPQRTCIRYGEGRGKGEEEGTEEEEGDGRDRGSHFLVGGRREGRREGEIYFVYQI
jgi:hypothetical protein